jgi:hypothetical protein
MNEDKTDDQIREEMVVIWKELGRDPDKIKLTTKTREELDDGLEKLKAVRMGFQLLFKADGNHALAVHLLAKVFLNEDEQEPIITEDGE